MSALGTEGKGFAISLLSFFIFFSGGEEGRGDIKSVSNVLLSSLSRSVLKIWVFLKFSAWSLFVRVS